MKRLPVTAWALALAACACAQTTGGEAVEFRASAAGPEDAVSPMEFVSNRGFRVLLTRARLHIGALYLNESAPISVAQETSCTLPGLYVAEVAASLDVDLLSASPVGFPELGRGNTHPAAVGEVWLSGGDVNAINDTTVILDIAGTASKGGADFPFDGVVTIGSNRAVAVKNPALPGSNPICKQRIVSPIPTDLTLSDGGELLLRIDPKGFFSNVDFSLLERARESPPLYRFADRTDGQPNINLYKGLRSRLGVYQFSWRNAGE